MDDDQGDARDERADGESRAPRAAAIGERASDLSLDAAHGWPDRRGGDPGGDDADQQRAGAQGDDRPDGGKRGDIGDARGGDSASGEQDRSRRRRVPQQYQRTDEPDHGGRAGVVAQRAEAKGEGMVVLAQDFEGDAAGRHEGQRELPSAKRWPESAGQRPGDLHDEQLCQARACHPAMPPRVPVRTSRGWVGLREGREKKCET